MYCTACHAITTLELRQFSRVLVRFRPLRALPAATTPLTMPHIPGDIIRAVLDSVVGDWNSVELQAVRLVNHEWAVAGRAPASRYLVIEPKEESFRWILTAAQAQSKLCIRPLVRNLTLEGLATTTVGELAAILNLFLGVTTLRLQFGIEIDDTVHEVLQPSSRTFHLLHIQHIQFTNPSTFIRFATIVPSVDTLQIGPHVTFIPLPPQRPLSPIIPSRHSEFASRVIDTHHTSRQFMEAICTEFKATTPSFDFGAKKLAINVPRSSDCHLPHTLEACKELHVIHLQVGDDVKFYQMTRMYSFVEDSHPCILTLTQGMNYRHIVAHPFRISLDGPSAR